jgi:hypothetical protein
MADSPAAAGSDQCVNFVNKQNHLTLRIYYFFDYRLQSLLKLPFVFGPSHQQTHIK